MDELNALYREWIDGIAESGCVATLADGGW